MYVNIGVTSGMFMAHGPQGKRQMIMVFIGFLSETQIIAPQCNHHQTVPQFAQYMNVMVGIQILFYFNNNGVYVIWPYYLTRYCLTLTYHSHHAGDSDALTNHHCAATRSAHLSLSLSLSVPRIRTSQTYINLFKVPYIYIYICLYAKWIIWILSFLIIA